MCCPWACSFWQQNAPFFLLSCLLQRSAIAFLLIAAICSFPCPLHLSAQIFAYRYANIYEPFSVQLCIVNFSLASGFAYGVEEAGNVGCNFLGFLKRKSPLKLKKSSS